MKNNYENVEIIEDGDIVTLYDEEENAHEFVEVGVVELDGEFYSLISPVTDDEEEAGDVCIFKVEQTEEGEEMLTAVEDETVADAVFEEFMRAYASSEYAEGCDCCHGDCDHEHGECDCNHDDCNHEHGECDCDHDHDKCKCGHHDED